VRDRLTAGDSDRQVLDYLVARYGDFVLLKPPFALRTLLLWGLPPLALITGLIGLLVAMLRRRALVEPKALDAAERHRLATLVEPGAD
jgi:cytochrome c-type biogenesis protein CcmH